MLIQQGPRSGLPRLHVSVVGDDSVVREQLVYQLEWAPGPT